MPQTDQTNHKPKCASGSRAIADARRMRKQAMRLDVEEWSSKTGLTRADLAERLCVSLDTLASWLALGSPRDMPGGYDVRWCTVTGSLRVRQVGSEQLGGRFLQGLELECAELGKIELRLAALSQESNRKKTTLLLLGGAA